MKAKTLKKYKIALLSIFLVGCTGDFEEVNQNPNNPIVATPNLLLTGVERDMMTEVLNDAWSIGNIVIQQTAKNQFVNEDRYLWGEINRIWNAVYDNMRDVNNILIRAEATSSAQLHGRRTGLKILDVFVGNRLLR